MAFEVPGRQWYSHNIQHRKSLSGRGLRDASIQTISTATILGELPDGAALVRNGILSEVITQLLAAALIFVQSLEIQLRLRLQRHGSGQKESA